RPSFTGRVVGSVTSKKPTVTQTTNTLLRVVTLLKIFVSSSYFWYGCDCDAEARTGRPSAPGRRTVSLSRPAQEFAAVAEGTGPGGEAGEGRDVGAGRPALGPRGLQLVEDVRDQRRVEEVRGLGVAEGLQRFLVPDGVQVDLAGQPLAPAGRRDGEPGGVRLEEIGRQARPRPLP